MDNRHFCTMPASRDFKARFKRISRRVASGTIAAVLLAVGLSGIATPQKSYAWAPNTHLPTCTSLGSDFNWDWKGAIQSVLGSSWSSMRPGMNLSTDTQDSLIGYQKLSGIAGRTYVTIGNAQGASYLYTDSVGTAPHAANPTSWTSVTTFYWDTGSHTVTALTDSQMQTQDYGHGTPVTGSIYDYKCIEFAQGYAQGIWGYNTNTSGTYASIAPNVTRPCDGLLQIACSVEDLFSSVGNTFLAVGQAILQGLGTLFVPNGSMLSADWTSFYNTLYTKLGFLTWPFSFVSNLFTAITTPTTTCCVIGAGTFMGAAFPGLDLAFVSTHLPDLWNYATAAIRGLTVLMLFFMLRAKFMEITAK